MYKYNINRYLYFINGSLDEKLPSYEVLKMRENRGVENRGVENRGVENRGVEHRGVEHRGVENRGVENSRVENRGVGWRMTPFAPRIVHDVSYVMRINHEIHFSWQA